jgi:hypothetical protein
MSNDRMSNIRMSNVPMSNIQMSTTAECRMLNVKRRMSEQLKLKEITGIVK